MARDVGLIAEEGHDEENDKFTGNKNIMIKESLNKWLHFNSQCSNINGR